MKKSALLIYASVTILLSLGFQDSVHKDQKAQKRVAVIFDTDANNELDDQQALAYLFFNSNLFDTKAVTVNATYNGGNIDSQFVEAERIMKLCKVADKIPLLKGANGSFTEIEKDLHNKQFDGYKAVNFIISEAKKHKKDKLIVIAVGKLTNMALALKKDPTIASSIRLVWLGSNYPDPGEYNLENDIPSMNYILQTNIDFEMVTVRYGKKTGTDAVNVTKNEAINHLKGAGPTITIPIIGRHGGEFYSFGAYSINLFEHVDYYGNPPSRALFDMAAVAIVKNANWAKSSLINCPAMINKKWIEQTDNHRKIIIWENFDKEKIINDFFLSLH
ncbi:MAG: nucleoside hydrolase [Bacteroidota bacterium]